MEKQSESAFFKLGYRPELDGLRGVSILLVFIHHIYHPFVPGGFLGVDIFFVLSGFLITSLLLQEFHQTDTINLRNFYLRRCLRLMPAVCFFILCVTFYALLFESPAAFAQTSQAALLTLIYVSNWFYAFGWASANNALGVTWSLAIEEQFYLVSPLILSLALSFKLKRKFMIYSLIIGVLAIAVYRKILWNADANVSRLYYGSDTRADALIIGCLTGLMTSWNLLPYSSRRFKFYLRILSAIVLSILIYLLAFEEWSDPILYNQAGYTVVSLCVALLLLLIIRCPPKFALHILQFTPLVWVGQVSYGLYLWHWASRYFIYRGSVLPPDATHLFLVVILSFGFTILSYYLIEKPFLKLKKRFTSLKAEQA